MPAPAAFCLVLLTLFFVRTSMPLLNSVGRMVGGATYVLGSEEWGFVTFKIVCVLLVDAVLTGFVVMWALGFAAFASGKFRGYIVMLATWAAALISTVLAKQYLVQNIPWLFVLIALLSSCAIALSLPSTRRYCSVNSPLLAVLLGSALGVGGLVLILSSAYSIGSIGSWINAS